MLLTTHNPTRMNGITHNVISHQPFTVEYISLSTGRTTVEQYAVPLTKKEIEAEYEYVTFPTPDKIGGSIGEIVPYTEIREMGRFMENHGYKAFETAVYHGAWGNNAYAYIHPCEEMRESYKFQDIQRAFINAYA